MGDTHSAVFETRHDAIAAVRSLQHEGVARSAITVMSSEPLHLETDELRRSRIPGFGIAGGFLGAAFAILLTVWPSRRVDLVTGGMPIVTPWAFGIIVFELTALGAILATLGRMIFEARLCRKAPLADHGTAVAEGRIIVSVDCASDSDRDICNRLLPPANSPAK